VVEAAHALKDTTAAACRVPPAAAVAAWLLAALGDGLLARIPWYRAHAVLLNDPGRLLSAHCVHSALAAGWAAAGLVFEVVLLDPSDPVFNPFWRQGAFLLPVSSRLGLGANPAQPFSLDDSVLAHAAVTAALLLAAGWHWAFWDLLLFSTPSRAAALHFTSIFGIHLCLAGLLCAGFGAAHLTFIGFWTTDSFGAYGSPRPLRPSFSIASAPLLRYGALAGHHIAACVFLAAGGRWHASSYPGPRLYAALALGNIEAILSSSISAFFLSGAVNACLMWYGGPLTPAGLYGPTRFSWDSSFYMQEIIFRSSLLSWNGLTDSMLMLDYIGVNPAKGGLFRAGPMVKGDGCIQAWVGHAFFQLSALAPLAVRRMPAFFETFPVLLLDRAGLVRGVIPFRRAESRWSLSAGSISVRFAGGVFDGTRLQQPALVKTFARKAQLGEIFTFERSSSAAADGLFRTSVRGWFTYSHALFVLFLVQGHLWHAARSLFKDIWTGVRASEGAMAEYGAGERLRG